MSAGKKKGHKKSAFWLTHVGNVKRILEDEISITDYGESLDGVNLACEEIIKYFEKEAESLKVEGEATSRNALVESFREGAAFEREQTLKKIETLLYE